MRTTIRLDPDTLAQAKLLAAQTGRSLTAVVEEALRQMLASQRRPPQREPVKLTTVSGNGPLPGVDLDDSASLLDLLDSPDGPHRR